MGLQGMIRFSGRSDYPVGDKLTDEVEQLASRSYGNCQNYFCSRNFPEIAKTCYGGYHKMNETCKTSSWNLRELEVQENL
jgi:methylmalonyl-CoA mutase